MVMAVSLAAAGALFAVFFAGLALAPTSRRGRIIGACCSAVFAGAAWALVTSLGRVRGWVRTEEAQFHHLYILASVGLPLVGAIILVASFIRPVKDRRARLGGRLIAGLFLVPAVVGVYATNIEPNWLRVDRHDVAVSGAPELRIGVIADLQTDEFGRFERDAVQAVMDEEPDIVLLAGDFTQVPTEEYPAIVDGAVETLGALDAPHGVFAVSGNTDPSVQTVADLAIASGLSSLDDEVVTFEVDGVEVRLLGVSWPNNRRVEATAAIRSFAGGTSANTLDIVVAHSPDIIFNLGRLGEGPDVTEGIDLIVTGHTHGGQIQVPFYGPVWNVTELPRDVAAGGLHEVAGVRLYVSTGVGVQRGESPKVRFGARPSVGVLEIASS